MASMKPPALDARSPVQSASPGQPSGRKTFIPLENNPEVMNSLLYSLGLSRKLAFVDVYSIDDPDLLAFVPRPAHALLLVFPISDTYEKFRAEEDRAKAEYAGSGSGEEVLWYKQTIANACGLIGILHAVNGHARSFVNAGSELEKLIDDAIPLKPIARADLLYESQALESAHQAAAAGGDTTAPLAEAEIDLHFVCFVKSKNGHLWELDGRRKGPLDRGQLAAEDDVLSDVALDLGIRSFLQRESRAGGGDLRFSLIALSESFD